MTSTRYKTCPVDYKLDRIVRSLCSPHMVIRNGVIGHIGTIKTYFTWVLRGVRALKGRYTEAGQEVNF